MKLQWLLYEWSNETPIVPNIAWESRFVYFVFFNHPFSSDPVDMNEEVLKIINEPDQQFDSDIDLSLYDINDLLEEEEVEIEY